MLNEILNSHTRRCRSQLLERDGEDDGLVEVSMWIRVSKMDFSRLLRVWHMEYTHKDNFLISSLKESWSVISGKPSKNVT